jgi:hypothetical protein
MAVRRTDWIVLNAATGNLECQRCGGFEKMLQDQRIPVVVAQMKSFGDMHKGCKEKTDERSPDSDGESVPEG